MQKQFILLLITACAFLFTTAQNVGIGTNTPIEKLHVNGNIKADTVKSNALLISANAGTGRILTSDAAGNGTWRDAAASSTPSNQAGGVGFGSWGDCSTNSISQYNPVTDTTPVVGDALGVSVSISGNFAIIGAPGNANAKGYASIYQFNGTNWVLFQKLFDPTGSATDEFGLSVAISDKFAVVGAFNDTVGQNLSQGSVCVFQFNGSSWVFMQKLTDPSGAAQDFFGGSVSISGNNILIGAFGDDVFSNTNQGSAIIFNFNGTTWNFVQKLTDPGGAANDNFGNAVSLSGNFAIISSPNDVVGANAGQGSASIFKFNGSNWVFFKKLVDPSGGTNFIFGFSVAISGNYAVVGSPQASVGSNIQQGSATVFQFNGTDWVFNDQLTDPLGTTGTQFGNFVAISGDLVLVGDADHGPNQAGTSLLFSRLGLQWQLLQNIIDPQNRGSNRFGTSTAIDSNTRRFVIGAPVYGGQSGKAVFGKVN